MKSLYFSFYLGNDNAFVAINCGYNLSDFSLLYRSLGGGWQGGVAGGWRGCSDL